MTLPWLLSAVAAALLLLTAACLVTGRPPVEIPARTGVLVCTAIQLDYAADLVIDGFSYGWSDDGLASIRECDGRGCATRSLTPFPDLPIPLERLWRPPR